MSEAPPLPSPHSPPAAPASFSSSSVGLPRFMPMKVKSVASLYCLWGLGTRLAHHMPHPLQGALPLGRILLHPSGAFSGATDAVQLSTDTRTESVCAPLPPSSPPTFSCSQCLSRSSTMALLTMPRLGLTSSPRASTRAHRDVLAASIREILPLFLGALWPTREAW